ncbi:MAG: GNAT family N-acetyltransferase [Pseudonocardia sp.]
MDWEQIVAALTALGASDPPIAGLTSRRTVGVNSVRISACRGEEVLGYIELDTDPADGGRLGQLSRWADIGNLHVVEAHRRRGIATWLVGQAADWLRLARVERLLDYAWTDETDRVALSHRLGFRELTRTARGWHRSGGNA